MIKVFVWNSRPLHLGPLDFADPAKPHCYATAVKSSFTSLALLVYACLFL